MGVGCGGKIEYGVLEVWGSERMARMESRTLYCDEKERDLSDGDGVCFRFEGLILSLAPNFQHHKNPYSVLHTWSSTWRFRGVCAKVQKPIGIRIQAVRPCKLDIFGPQRIQSVTRSREKWGDEGEKGGREPRRSTSGKILENRRTKNVRKWRQEGQAKKFFWKKKKKKYSNMKAVTSTRK